MIAQKIKGRLGNLNKLSTRNYNDIFQKKIQRTIYMVSSKRFLDTKNSLKKLNFFDL